MTRLTRIRIDDHRTIALPLQTTPSSLLPTPYSLLLPPAEETAQVDRRLRALGYLG